MLPVRDIFVFGVVMASLPYAFLRPFYGLLVFTWLAYMRPQDLCWDFARPMRFSFMVGAAMLLGFLANEAGRRRFTIWDARTVAMASMVLTVTLSLAFAHDQGEYVVYRYSEFLKVILVAMFTAGQVDSRLRLKTLLWTIALCLGFFGIKGGIHGILSGGSPILRGPGGMLEDNNDFSLALAMNIPLLLYLGFDEKNVWIRRGCVAGVALTIVTVLLTHSRGGFLALCAVMTVFLLRSKKKWLGLGGVGLVAAGFFLLAPDHVRERIALIGEGIEEGSAHARWVAWQIALRMVQAYPFLGVGIRNFQGEWDNFSHGLPPVGGGFAYVAHNSYLQIWAEGGTLTFLPYVFLLVSCWWVLGRLRRAARGRPERFWIFNYARMLEASGVAFLVGGTFLNRGHFDLIYHLMGVVSAFAFLAWREMAQEGGRRPEHAGGEAVAAAEGPPRVIGSRTWGMPAPALPAGSAPGGPAAPRWGR